VSETEQDRVPDSKSAVAPQELEAVMKKLQRVADTGAGEHRRWAPISQAGNGSRLGGGIEKWTREEKRIRSLAVNRCRQQKPGCDAAANERHKREDQPAHLAHEREMKPDLTGGEICVRKRFAPY
jgi:hypothetical protein